MIKLRGSLIDNRKGDIPVVILVIEVVLICILTILSFAYFNIKFNDNFLGVGMVETVNSISKEVSLSQRTGLLTDYGNSFDSGALKVEIEGKEIEGVYVTKTAPIFGEEKIVVRVNYKMP